MTDSVKDDGSITYNLGVNVMANHASGGRETGISMFYITHLRKNHITDVHNGICNAHLD